MQRFLALVFFPRMTPMCDGQMLLIVFITEGTHIVKIQKHIRADSQPPRISPARGPPLWDGCNAQVGEGWQIEPERDLAAQTAILNRRRRVVRPAHTAHRKSRS
jgi:hypothetical protein